MNGGDDDDVKATICISISQQFFFRYLFFFKQRSVTQLKRVWSFYQKRRIALNESMGPILDFSISCVNEVLKIIYVFLGGLFGLFLNFINFLYEQKSCYRCQILKNNKQKIYEIIS